MKKILLVDDSKVQRTVIAKIIMEAGFKYEILQAPNGQEAIGVIKENFNDMALILCDWNMPVMTGIQFLESLKQTWPDIKVPVMMVTTEATEYKTQQARSVYPDLAGYIMKPFNAEDLKKAITPVLS